MDIKIKSNIQIEVNAFRKFVEDFKTTFKDMADPAIKEFASQLKQNMLDLVKSYPQTESLVKSETLSLVREYNYFKYEKDLIEALFGEDLAKIALNKENLAYNTFGLNSNIHVMDSGFLRSFRRISQDSTLNDVLEDYRSSLNNGLIVDKDTGEIFILGEELSKDHFDSGVKLFCTTSRGVTPWSEEVFNKYKTGKRKVSGLGDGELAVPLTIKKRDLDRHLKKAIPLGKIQDLIMEGKYDSAINLLQKSGPNRFKNAIEVVEEMKAGGSNLSDEAKNLNEVIKTVKEVKVAKYTKKDSVSYKLSSSLEEGSDSLTSKELHDQIYPVLVTYLPDLEEKIIMSIIKAIDDAIKKYGTSK